MKHCNGCNKDKELDKFYSYFSKEVSKKKAVKELKDHYVNEQIARVLNIKLSDYSIPAELTEAYRLNIKIKRRWREIK